MSKQIKTTSYILFFKQKSCKSTSESNSIYSFLEKLILYSFSILLEQSTRVSQFLTSLVLVSYKPVSYKKMCKSVLHPQVDQSTKRENIYHKATVQEQKGRSRFHSRHQHTHSNYNIIIYYVRFSQYLPTNPRLQRQPCFRHWPPFRQGYRHAPKPSTRMRY